MSTPCQRPYLTDYISAKAAVVDSLVVGKDETSLQPESTSLLGATILRTERDR